MQSFIPGNFYISEGLLKWQSFIPGNFYISEGLLNCTGFNELNNCEFSMASNKAFQHINHDLHTNENSTTLSTKPITLA